MFFGSALCLRNRALCSGPILWLCSLALHSGSYSGFALWLLLWLCSLALHSGSALWLCTLALHSLCTLALHSGSVLWICTLAPKFSRWITNNWSESLGQNLVNNNNFNKTNLCLLNWKSINVCDGWLFICIIFFGGIFGHR